MTIAGKSLFNPVGAVYTPAVFTAVENIIIIVIPDEGVIRIQGMSEQNECAYKENSSYHIISPFILYFIVMKYDIIKTIVNVQILRDLDLMQCIDECSLEST